MSDFSASDPNQPPPVAGQGGSPPPPPPPNLSPPPGYQAYSAAPTPVSGSLSRVSGLSKAVVILAAVAAVGSVVTAITTPGAVDSARQFRDGAISESRFLDDYTAYGLTQTLQGIGTLATAVLTIIWLYRIAKNVRVMGRATTWAPIWAVFGWILPPVLIIIPFLMVREMWKASNPDVGLGAEQWKQGDENPLIIVWFVLYGIVPAILTVISSSNALSAGFEQDAEDVARVLDESGSVTILGSIVSAVAAVVWILVVRQLTARHVAFTNER